MNPSPSDYQPLTLPLSYWVNLEGEVSLPLLLHVVACLHIQVDRGSKKCCIVNLHKEELTLHQSSGYGGHLSDLLCCFRMKIGPRNSWNGNLWWICDSPKLFKMEIWNKQMLGFMFTLNLISAFYWDKLWVTLDFHFNAVIDSLIYPKQIIHSKSLASDLSWI